MYTRIKNAVIAVSSNIWPKGYRQDVLPPREMRAAMDLPWVRGQMIRFSRDEYERNPYYASVVNKQSEQTIGPCPTMIATSEESEANDLMEDSHQEWTQLNLIGKNLRDFRKEACLTGIGLAIRFKMKTDHPVKVGYKIYGGDVLVNPPGTSPEDRIVDGIQYDEDWEPVKFFFSNDAFGEDPIEYDAKDVLYWSKGYESGRIRITPECISGFTVYPFIRRYLQASIEAAEFRTSFPMALELDTNIYGKNDAYKLQGLSKFQYQPRSVPTLPVGTSLKGLPQGTSSDQMERMIRSMASACALSIDMPANLALGDSSDSNMASAQVDIQPWKNRVNIDRFDLLRIKRRMFKDWYTRARLIRGLTPAIARDKDYESWFPHNYVYDPLFQHPDPLKNANARMIDLTSGSSTLNRSYAELGRNARRDLERESKLLGISYQELAQHYLAARTKLSLQITGEEDDSEATRGRSSERTSR